MRDPATAILRTQQTVEILRKFFAKPIKLVGVDPNRNSLAEIHQALLGRTEWAAGRDAGQISSHLIFGGWRKGPEEG